ncbi:Dihydroorotase [Dorcoceras hygrometricum]|uniref:dihydroorotase n=1 Tax=Dorcoceras hygrometricum TaxID=472368 RepID=A0A2Z7CCX1_9LAMI|nr:Dihydroorotase [Dorcoceras hygrometricum]
MPNLKPPVTTVAQAEAYRARILAGLPADTRFQPLMTLYLTEATAPEEIARARASGIVHAVKYYPAGATTNSQAGVRDLAHVYPVLEAMERHGLPLLMHGEVTDPAVDIFDREHVFIERHLIPLRARFPQLRMVLEHITTRAAAEFIRAAPAHALVEAATSGDPHFFLGTDSAPHARGAKEAACGCAGIYTAHAAIELYAEAFELAGKLDRLEAFASFHGADFYGLPRNRGKITLERKPWTVPEALPFADSTCIPFRAGREIAWALA